MYVIYMGGVEEIGARQDVGAIERRRSRRGRLRGAAGGVGRRERNRRAHERGRRRRERRPARDRVDAARLALRERRASAFFSRIRECGCLGFRLGRVLDGLGHSLEKPDREPKPATVIFRDPALGEQPPHVGGARVDGLAAGVLTPAADGELRADARGEGEGLEHLRHGLAARSIERRGVDGPREIDWPGFLAVPNQSRIIVHVPIPLPKG